MTNSLLKPTNLPSDEAIISLGQSVIDTEASAVAQLRSRIDGHFVRACNTLLNCQGRIVVCGIGKSGHIGAKLAATFASTGSPAFFVHAAEASHGDLGMLQKEDVVVAISYSGNSSEITALLPGIKRLGVPLIAICGEPDSPLARSAEVVLDTRVEREACPLGLAPTASTTAVLALGDALAIALLSARGFTEEDFARSHPGGRLGRRLLLKVTDVMIDQLECPACNANAALSDALLEISSKGLGMVVVLDDQRQLQGVFTDGDLRRTIDRNLDIRQVQIREVMTRKPATINPDALAVTAVTMMQDLKITSLPVIDAHKFIGIVTMHGLLAAGVV